MPNLPAAKKSIRADKRKHDRNQAVKSRLKTLIKSITNAIEQKKKQEASQMLKTIMSALDKAAKSGIIKKNMASRKIARLSSKIAKL